MLDQRTHTQSILGKDGGIDRFLNRQATCINHDAGAQSARPPPLPVKVGIGAMVVGQSTKGDGNKVEATNTNARPRPSSFVAAAQHHQRRPSLRRPLTRNCSYQCLTELTNFMIKGKNLGCENRARIDISCSQMLKFLIRLLNII